MKSFGNIAKDGQVRAVASGALTDGKAVIVNADGTVSVVGTTARSESVGTRAVFDNGQIDFTAVTFDSNSNKFVVAWRDNVNSYYGTAAVGTVDPSDNSITYGSDTVFESANTKQVAAGFDSTNNKVVLAYKDAGNSNYGTAIVGTVSGTSISFGTAVVFESAITSDPSVVFDSNEGKIVISYRDSGDTDKGKSTVGTVSGTSISFGSPVQFGGSYAYYNDSTFDSTNNKVVVVWMDLNDSQKGKAIVGTVSGTSISFGSEVTFHSGTTGEFNTATFDSSSGKIIVTYVDAADSNKGKALVGTVSGTSISFGSEAIFHNAATYRNSAVYDPTSNKTLIAYSDASTSNGGTFVMATVSGTSISFGSEAVFEAGEAANISTTYDSNNDRVVIVYEDDTDSDQGSAVAITTAASVNNITSENFIGFSDGAFATTQSAVINTANTIDRNQTSLTPGQTYFVTPAGALSTTAGSPSVKAGTAISSKELIVKG